MKSYEARRNEANKTTVAVHSDNKYMTNVLLLREPSEGTPDRYQTALSAAGYLPISVPVLETLYTNIPHLRDVIQKGPKALGYHGVIITSKRSCDAWRQALQLLSPDDDIHAIGKVFYLFIYPLCISLHCLP